MNEWMNKMNEWKESPGNTHFGSNVFVNKTFSYSYTEPLFIKCIWQPLKHAFETAERISKCTYNDNKTQMWKF